MAAFLADKVSSVYPNAPPGSFFYGDPGVTKSFTTNPIWNFNPNIGATWDPFGNGNTVIRGGLQVAYDEANFYTTNRNHQNPPFATNVNVSTTGPICFSEPWLLGGTGYGCDQVGGTNQSPFPQPTVPTPATAVFPAQGEWIVIANPYKVPDTLAVDSERSASVRSRLAGAARLHRQPYLQHARWHRGESSNLHSGSVGNRWDRMRSRRDQRPSRSCRKDGGRRQSWYKLLNHR
jgi:hypothetical protein